MHGMIFDFGILSPNRGEQWIVAVAGHCGTWRRPWPSSWKAFSHARNVPASCGANGRCGDFCWAYCPPRLTGWSTEGPADGGLVLVKGRTVFDGCYHARRGSCIGGST